MLNFEEESNESNEIQEEMHVDVVGEEDHGIENEIDDIDDPDTTEDNRDLVRVAEVENLVCNPDILSEESDDSDINISHKKPQVLSESEDENYADSSMTSEKYRTDITAKKVLDELKRPHIVVNRTGPGFIFFGSSQLNPSTSEGHVNDLLTIFEESPELKKKFLILICDDGKFCFSMCISEFWLSKTMNKD